MSICISEKIKADVVFKDENGWVKLSCIGTMERLNDGSAYIEEMRKKYGEDSVVEIVHPDNNGGNDCLFPKMYLVIIEQK